MTTHIFVFEEEKDADRQLYLHIVSLFKQNPRTEGHNKSIEVDLLLKSYERHTGKKPKPWALEMMQEYITRRDDGKDDKFIITPMRARRNLWREDKIADYEVRDEHNVKLNSQLNKIMEKHFDNKIATLTTSNQKGRRSQ